ncbi:Zinc finger protein 830 [Trichoplax sp. H2]|nr:Zinc finger protein 830 [Trichoplax sp. H2]|eukprot:RDD40652.1 Zinc finger protein 830 [Trichoplax sp. H2]
MSSFRKLIKGKASQKKINSPLARYSNTGQLSCAICNCNVKNELLWNAHIQSKKHKEVSKSKDCVTISHFIC